MKYLDSIN